MIERDKEYYNKKIGELYAVIENQEKIIRDLQEKINTYENPEDLTLMFMYCEEKTKDKVKQLQRRIDKAIKYIEENIHFCENDSQGAYDVCNIRIASDKKLLEILKGENNEKGSKR